MQDLVVTSLWSHLSSVLDYGVNALICTVKGKGVRIMTDSYDLSDWGIRVLYTGCVRVLLFEYNINAMCVLIQRNLDRTVLALHFSID